jgi:hypothetical protein
MIVASESRSVKQVGQCTNATNVPASSPSHESERIRTRSRRCCPVRSVGTLSAALPHAIRVEVGGGRHTCQRRPVSRRQRTPVGSEAGPFSSRTCCGGYIWTRVYSRCVSGPMANQMTRVATSCSPECSLSRYGANSDRSMDLSAPALLVRRAGTPTLDS